ncbi:ankyrin [Xylaria arbuscula]|nr:ankyrin [Xylaria arbuscula]
MEAIGAGANVATFVVIAAQLSKILYTTFHGIKDGPDAVRRVAGHMQQLHGVLEQLRLSPLAVHDDALVGHITLCIKDLNHLADDVGKLQFLPSEQRTGRLWKRFKCFLDKEKLDDIRDQLIQHTSTLSLRHSILQSNAISKTLSTAYLATQSIEVLNQKMIQQTQGHATELNALGQNMQCLLTSQTDTLQSNLSSIQSNISSVSHSNSNAMLDVLNEIKTLVISNSSRESNQQEGSIDCAPGRRDNPSRGTGAGEDFRQDSSLNDSLLRTVTRLCDLVKLKNRTFDVHEEYDSEAEDIIEDLQTLLSQTRRYGDLSKTAPVSPVVLRREMRRFNQAFGQFTLAVNAEGQRNKRNPRMTTTQDQINTEFHITDIGKLSFRTIKRTRIAPLVAEENRKRKEIYSDHDMVITFIPYDTKKLNMIMASTFQRSSWGNAAPSISRLDINRVLPKGSLVFEVVRNGDLRALQIMLQNGEASLRDHDEFGANLLMYSVKQPELCKFLLSTNSFDLDHVGDYMGVNNFSSSISTTILNVPLVKHSTNIYRLLLEAGADPTIRGFDTHSGLERALATHSGENMRDIWYITQKYYFDSYFNDTRLKASRALLVACLYPDFCSKEKFSFFGELGADFSITDYQGCSCLHLYFMGFYYKNKLKSLDSIKCLLDNGADPCACDREGVSVSESAYEKKGYLGQRLSSFPGDLWDRALHDCGYDIAEFRRPRHQRIADYNRNYTREDFALLWQGHEDECPYWNDTPWPRSTTAMNLTVAATARARAYQRSRQTSTSKHLSAQLRVRSKTYRQARFRRLRRIYLNIPVLSRDQSVKH